MAVMDVVVAEAVESENNNANLCSLSLMVVEEDSRDGYEKASEICPAGMHTRAFEKQKNRLPYP